MHSDRGVQDTVRHVSISGRVEVKVLALGAHPDDFEIFMFGTLAACAQLTFAIATDGAKGG